MDWGDRRRAFSEPAPGRLPSSALQGCLPASVTTTPRALKRNPLRRSEERLPQEQSPDDRRILQAG